MRQLWRYLVLATAIVLTIAVYATMRARLGDLGSHVRFWKATAPPPKSDTTVGDAPWALSALPDCFIQRAQTTGNAAYVRGRLPANAQLVAAGTRLTYGPCTIFVRGDELLVERGSDRLRVPPRAQLYTAGNSLVLLRVSAARADLRTYDIATQQ